MVLCKFFQQGTCRFGYKCVNEHLDVKQVIKTDIEASINGKQWPLSTYGPFKDKPSIPNFIEDQSFEEIRLLCYEAKRKNFFEQFHQQFTKEAMDANNKMKALLQMTPEVIDVLIKIYDMPSDSSCSGATSGITASANSGSSFGSSNTGSIFSKPNTTVNNNIFGNTVTAGGGFGPTNVTGSNIFCSTAHNQNSTNIFGNASAFGSQQQQQSSIFGQSAMQSNSIFGGNTTNNQQKPSLFAQQQPSQANASTMGGNIFASASQPQSQQFGLFSQQNQQPQLQQSSIFGQQQQNTNIFGQTSQAQSGLFAQAAQSMQQQNTQGLFGQVSQQQANSSQGLFAQAAQQTQSVFGQAMQQQQLPNTNVFQQPQSNTGQQQQQLSNTQPTTGLFQQTAQQTQNSVNALAPVNSTLYSRIEDLTAEEIEAFKSDCFQPGKIPFNPPPRELIN